MFKFLKKIIKKKEVTKQMANIDEVKKAYETLSDAEKEEFKVNILGNKESEEKLTEDKPEEIPAIEEEQAEPTAEKTEEEPEKEEPQPIAEPNNDNGIREEIAGLKAEIEALKNAIAQEKQQPKPVTDNDKAATLNKLAARYNAD